MKKLPFILIALAIFLVLRIALRHRQHGQRKGRGESIHHARDWRPLGNTGLVAGREIHARIRNRVFKVITAILFLAIGAAVVIPTIHSNKAQTTRVGIVSDSTQLAAELQTLAKGVGVKVLLADEPSMQQARDGLNSHRLDLVVDGTKTILVESPISASDTSAQASYVHELSQILGKQQAYTQARLTAKQASILGSAKPLPVKSVKPQKNRSTSETTALLGVILIFIVLNQYLTWTLMGVMEEKASRVIEVLLATVRPIQLLGGKVLGIGIVALTQAVALVGFALVLGAAVGSSLVHGSASLVIAATFIWLILGYAFYSWVYAAAGSLAERQDQVQSLILPLSVPLIFGYIVSLVGASSGTPSLLVKILAYLPPTAPFAMPTLVGFGEATWWQFSLSVVLCLLSTIAVAYGASRVYRSAVLRTGSRVKLRQLR